MDDEPADVVDCDRYEWERIVRRCVLPMPVKSVAAYTAQYANRDGSHVYPGVARLTAVTGLSERSVRNGLTVLRELGLLTRTRNGSSKGRQALTDEYKLTYPADLIDRVHMLDVDESPASAACVPSCRHAGSPARPAAAKAGSPAHGAAAPGDSGQEHRHLVPGTPAPGAGTPAPHDRNTGRRCTPPNHDPLTDPLIDQRDRPVENATTGDDMLAKLIEIDRVAARSRA